MTTQSAKCNELILTAERRQRASVCDLRSRYISKKVKELEVENELLMRLAAHSEREIAHLRGLLAGSSSD